jgi:frataxin
MATQLGKAPTIMLRGCCSGTSLSCRSKGYSDFLMPFATRGMATLLSRPTTNDSPMMDMVVAQESHRNVQSRGRQFHRSSSQSFFTRSSVTKSSTVVPLSVRFFQSEAEYHNVADDTLESIQDALDALFESMPSPPQMTTTTNTTTTPGEFEVNYSSGVLTIVMPPHGTWVLNKQTPNQQIWWSSPLSGPRRYEYEHDQWVFTRSDDGGGSAISLGQTLKDEIRQLYQLEINLDNVK